MNKLKVVFNSIKEGAIKHSPEILIGIGVTGFITSTVLAIRVTPKADILMKEIKEKHSDEGNKKEYYKEVVKKIVPIYIPTIATSLMSATCIIGANAVNSKRNAALATAYSLTEGALKEYQNKVIETIGEKKEKAIQDDIAKDHLAKNPVSNNEVIITTSGNTLFYDSISGRYFTSDIEKVKKIENQLNKRMISENYLSLNELYYELGLRCTEQGNELGFNIGDGLIEFRFSAQLADDDRPCIVLGYHVAPRYGYSDLS